MDDIIEFLVELILEIGSVAADSEETPRLIRKILIGIFITLYFAVTSGLFVTGILLWYTSHLFSVILIGFGIIFLFGGILKYQHEKKKSRIEP